MSTLIGIPCMDYMPLEFVSSLMALEKGKGQYVFYSNSLVYDARNNLALMALDYDYLLFLDSDMVFPDNTLNYLIELNQDIVCELYYDRRGKYQAVAFSEVIPKRFGKNPSYTRISKIKNQYIQGAGMGICLIKTKVLKDLYKHCDNPFEPYKGLGEDLAFFHRARKKGYKVYLDTKLKAKHIGTKKY